MTWLEETEPTVQYVSVPLETDRLHSVQNSDVRSDQCINRNWRHSYVASSSVYALLDLRMRRCGYGYSSNVDYFGNGAWVNYLMIQGLGWRGACKNTDHCVLGWAWVRFKRWMCRNSFWSFLLLCIYRVYTHVPRAGPRYIVQVRLLV